MTLATTTRTFLKLALAAAVVPTMAAFAEAKPALLLLHRNIQNTADEQRWHELNDLLAYDGFRVLSMAVPANETAAEGTAKLKQWMTTEQADEKVVVISTAAASDIATSFAQTEPTRIQAIAYISAEPSVATLGPRTVAVPSDLTSRIPTYQVKITGGRVMSNLYERGASTYKVREQGHSTLANLYDLENTIKTIARTKSAPATVQIASNV